MCPGDPWLRQSVKPKSTPVESGQIPCDEVPAPPQQDKPVRVHRAVARCTAAIGVVELQALAVPAGLGHRDKDNCIDAGGGLLPWKRNGHRGKCVDSAPERSGHDLDHLAKRSQRGLLDAHNRARLDRRVQPYADGDRFVVVKQEGRKDCARCELVATVYSTTRPRPGSPGPVGGLCHDGASAARPRGERPGRSQPSSAGTGAGTAGGGCACQAWSSGQYRRI